MPSDNRLNISQLAEATDIKTVTLRAWERRYGLLKPARDEKGHRYYSDDDVASIEAIKIYLEQGVAIRNIKALLQRGETREEGAGDAWQDQRQSLLDALFSAQPGILGQKIAEIFSLNAYDQVLEKLIQPLSLELADRDPSGQEIFSALWDQACSDYLRKYPAVKGGKRKSWLIVSVASEDRQLPFWCFCHGLAEKGFPVHAVMSTASADAVLTLPACWELEGVVVWMASELKESAIRQRMHVLEKVQRYPVVLATPHALPVFDDCPFPVLTGNVSEQIKSFIVSRESLS